MRKPDDPAHAGITLDNCVNGYYDDGIEGSVVVASRMPRATAISHFARELGVTFKEVKCETTYARLLTRQDVWDDYGRDRFEDDLIDEDEMKFDSSSPSGWRWKSTEEPVVFEETPAEPPEDWEPREEDPAWSRCKQDDPGATKVYIMEERI